MSQKPKDIIQIFLIYLLAFIISASVVIYFPPGNPLKNALLADLIGTIVVFIFSVIYRNSSVYDPYWSVVPIFIAIYWLINSGNFLESDYFALILVALIIVWGIRLTVNWMLRWNDFKDEDWRYVNIKNKTGKFYWPVSFLGIHLMPTLWVFFGMIPVYYAIYYPAELTPAIVVFAIAITVFAIWLEATADNQLRNHLIIRESKNLRLKTGVWSVLPFPNYTGEMLFWWGLYLFSVGFNLQNWWTFFGPLLITLLFLFISIPMMKKRLSNKKS